MEDRTLENHVNKWIKSVDVIDSNLSRFEQEEKSAYTTIRNLFGKKRPNIEILSVQSNILEKYLHEGVKDELYTAVKNFLKTTEIAKENFQAFKEFLEDKEFFGSSVGAGGNFEGSSVATATYRRVEIDGDMYEGLFLGNERVYKGKITYSDGCYYEGEWDNNGPHGEGIMKDEETERTYKGRFDSKEDGHGRIEWDDGDWYEGAWVDFEPTGQGVWQADGVLYKGEFTDGECTGKGRIEWDNGEWYEGGWNEEGAHGYGVWHIGNRIDRGDYFNGDRTGKGRMEWDNGDWYEGEWNAKGANGYGVQRFEEYHRTDKGYYKDHNRIKEGRMDWDNGDWYEGGWDANGYAGHGTQYIKSNQRFIEADWKDNNPVGKAKVWWENGNKYEGTWSWDSNGNLSGVGEYYYANSGKTRSGSWVNGNWTNDWSTPRNITSVFLWIMAAISMLAVGGWGWLVGFILIYIGKKVYEGK